MKAFIIGVSGGTGGRVADQLLQRGDAVAGIARRQEQLGSLAEKGIAASLGDIVTITERDLADAMAGSDVVLFSAGAGGRDGDEATTAIDGRGPGKAAAAAILAGVKRFYLVSVFPEAWRERHLGEDFEHYILEKKNAEADLVTRDLDWVILRPSALLNDPGTGRVDLGYAKIHDEICRDDVATTLVALMDEPRIRRVILAVTGGATPIPTAVADLAARSD